MVSSCHRANSAGVSCPPAPPYGRSSLSSLRHVSTFCSHRAKPKPRSPSDTHSAIGHRSPQSSHSPLVCRIGEIQLHVVGIGPRLQHLGGESAAVSEAAHEVAHPLPLARDLGDWSSRLDLHNAVAICASEYLLFFMSALLSWRAAGYPNFPVSPGPV